MRYILILLFGISSCLASANVQLDIPYTPSKSLPTFSELQHFIDSSSSIKPRAKKLKAVLLAVFLGHFGVHRIYLGTTPNVPIVYSLTLGGGFGLLPLLDIVAILSSKNLDEFSNNNQVFMWSNSR